MKSKMAEETINTSAYKEKTYKVRGCGNITDKYIFEPNVILAIGRAEQDARDRAIKAYCETATCVWKQNCKHDITNDACPGLCNFMRAYDN